jgi:hypothetical protein
LDSGTDGQGGGSAVAPSLPDAALSLQRIIGNRAVTGLLGGSNPANPARPRPLLGAATIAPALMRLMIQREGEPWQETGNLIGDSPVRDPVSPPNTSVVENVSIYQQRRAAAEGELSAQLARANSMLDDDGNVVDQRYWFAKVYYYVTQGELEEAAKGTFFYPSAVMQDVRYFEKIYADNVQAANEGGDVEEHWAEAFRVAADNEGATASEVAGGILGYLGGGLAAGPAGAVGGAWLGAATASAVDAAESLVASMQAHIRFDLPRAIAWVFNQYYASMPGVQLGDFQHDYMSMIGIFDRAGAKMNEEIADHAGVPVDMMPRILQDTSMAYWFEAHMGAERADAWARAEELVDLGLAGEGPYEDTEEGLSGDVTEEDNLSGVQALPPALRPLMEDPSEEWDDNRAREVAEAESGALDQRSTTDRIRMIVSLCRGITLNADEATIIAVLEASETAGDLVTVVDGAGAWDILFAADFSDHTTIRRMFRDSYYGSTSQSVALTLIRRCMDGETAEWEEEMVADILEARAGGDGREIITQIGAIYDEGGFDEGVNKIQWQLDFGDQSRFEAAYGID